MDPELLMPRKCLMNPSRSSSGFSSEIHGVSMLNQPVSSFELGLRIVAPATATIQRAGNSRTDRERRARTQLIDGGPIANLGTIVEAPTSHSVR